MARDLGAAGSGSRFLAISEKLNENPNALLEALTRLRIIVGSAVLLILIGVYVSLDGYQIGGAKSGPSGLVDV